MKYQKWGQNLWFLSFQNWVLSSYFAISLEPLDQNSSLIPFWKATLQMLRKWRLEILKKSGDWDLVSPNCPNVKNTLKYVKLDPYMIITIEQSLIWCEMISWRLSITFCIFLTMIWGIRAQFGPSFPNVPQTP